MSELKREYWSDTLNCITGKVKIDRREIAAIVQKNVSHSSLSLGNLDIHLKSGTIFTVKECSVDTIANLYLTRSPHEEVHVVPNTFTMREGEAPINGRDIINMILPTESEE